MSKTASGIMGAIKTDGTLWVWGYNASNQFLSGLSGYRSSPSQVGAGTDWFRVYTAYSSSAIKTTGTLWAWGNNQSGQIGNNSRSTTGLIQIGALTNWAIIGQGSSSKIARKTDGTLWAWGGNEAGQLGQNNRIYRSSPVQVGANTTWSDVSGNSNNGNSFLATKTDGTLWAWGNNQYGQLGQNDRVYRSSPTQVGSSTNWSKVFKGYPGRGESFAIKTDGTLWAWGGNSGGSLGLNNTIYRSSPTQVGTATGWNDLVCTQQGVLALKTT
jgi:alpha-tubulin suppressor-like RCC1 family protein